MFEKLLHITLVLNLLVSSTGVTVFEHICSKNGSSFAFFIKPQSCCSKKKSRSCHKSRHIKQDKNENITLSKKPCCEDKYHFDKLNFAGTSIEQTKSAAIQPIFLHNPIVKGTLSSESFVFSERSLRFNYYKPPPLNKENIRVLYKSFIC